MEQHAQKQRILAFTVSRTARLAALVAAISTLVIALPTGLAIIVASLIGLVKGGGVAAYLPLLLMGSFVAAPLAAFVFGFLLTALACAVYNALVPRFGGIEVELAAAPVHIISGHS